MSARSNPVFISADECLARWKYSDVPVAGQTEGTVPARLLESPDRAADGSAGYSDLICTLRHLMAPPGASLGPLPNCRANGPSACLPSRASTVWTPLDRKSTRLNSSHLVISYAVF